MARLIDADALRKKISDVYENKNIYQMIDEMPTIDAVPVVHGRWLNIANIANGYCPDLSRCSECNGIYFGIGGYNYCPSCGVKMDGETREGDNE